jgi:hypothetical protein
MDILSDLLNKMSKNFSNDILQFYEQFYSYTLDLMNNKNIDFNKQISEVDEDLQVLINSINSALNTTGIPITELSNHALLKNLFKDAFIAGETNFKNLFDKVGKGFINKHLFKSILEYVLDIDTIKIENLDLFDLLPVNFKHKLDELKKNLTISDNDRQKIKSLFSTINKDFDTTTLKFKNNRVNNSEEGMDILKKLQEAKENNIQVLKDPNQHGLPSNTVKIHDEVQNVKQSSYFDFFGNFPLLDSQKIQNIKVDVKNFSEIVFNMDLLMDLENLFYFISISKMLGLNNLIQQKRIIIILKNFVRGSIFSSGMYHISNPISNFYGLCILSELDILQEDMVNFVDFIDIEMFLESEIKIFNPSKFFLNFYSFLSLKILERHGMTVVDKSDLLNLQLSLDFSNINPEDLPRDLLCHLTLIKLIKKDFKFNHDFTDLNFNDLLSSNDLINGNITDSARVLLIFDILNRKDNTLIKRLDNAILSNLQAFSGTYPQLNWKSDILALKTELRMLFWSCLALLRY